MTAVDRITKANQAVDLQSDVRGSILGSRDSKLLLRNVKWMIFPLLLDQESLTFPQDLQLRVVLTDQCLVCLGLDHKHYTSTLEKDQLDWLR